MMPFYCLKSGIDDVLQYLSLPMTCIKNSFTASIPREWGASTEKLTVSSVRLLDSSIVSDVFSLSIDAVQA